ncbi:MAG TPA: hypothetical protein VKQ34_04445 [Candidatus Saccharimonadales bacterium]|nr:hypothetical protein [Candidatus Saccharimonadales bacterium]
MADKKPTKADKPLQDFIAQGGRPRAEGDFNRILGKAVKPKKG